MLDRQEAEFGRVFWGVHRECVRMSGWLADEFTNAYCGVLGEGRRADAHALLSGFANRTLDRAVALWQLGRDVRTDVVLLTKVQDAAATGTASVGDSAFDRRMAAFLEEFGHTIDERVVDAPTWFEVPSPAIELVLLYAQEADEAAPARAGAEQAARRKRLEAELQARAEVDARARPVLDALSGAQQLLPVLEDHNTICDQRLVAASRYRWLGIGLLLTARGLAIAPDDVFYLRYDELVQALETGVAPAAAVLEARRREQAAYRAAHVPPVLGQPLPVRQSVAGTLRGVRASPGRYRGQARVIRSLAEADRLRDGDVLVCMATAPAWTPYFALAGALVTDTGGALSHTAIVAREYGIPAVVGTRTGTSDIEDGTLIEVDGTEGVVRFL